MAQYGYRFTPANQGDYLAGIPARDLTPEDVDSLTPEQQELLKANLESEHPVYVAVAPAQVVKPVAVVQAAEHADEEVTG